VRQQVEALRQQDYIIDETHKKPEMLNVRVAGIIWSSTKYAKKYASQKIMPATSAAAR
jgi:hypothetical protein